MSAAEERIIELQGWIRFIIAALLPENLEAFDKDMTRCDLFESIEGVE